MNQMSIIYKYISQVNINIKDVVFSRLLNSIPLQAKCFVVIHTRDAKKAYSLHQKSRMNEKFFIVAFFQLKSNTVNMEYKLFNTVILTTKTSCNFPLHGLFTARSLCITQRNFNKMGPKISRHILNLHSF